jgi:uncharacterized protein YukE
MATLLMEVDTVQATQAKMVQNKETMLSELTALTSQINQTVGTAWQGNSATEFQQQYDALRNQITQQLDALEQMAQALQNEITQWNETASRMG